MNVDIVDEEPPGAGHSGPLLRARCTDCDKVSLKRTTRIVGETDTGSFKHVCHTCQSVSWWNVLEVVDEPDDDDPELVTDGGREQDHLMKRGELATLVHQNPEWYDAEPGECILCGRESVPYVYDGVIIPTPDGHARLRIDESCLSCRVDAAENLNKLGMEQKGLAAFGGRSE
jgi:hypothetical protein